MTKTSARSRAGDHRTRVITGALLVACATACPAEPVGPSGSDDCEDERRVGLLDGREDCGIFAGSGGAWVGQPLFSLPEGYLERFCRYAWQTEDSAAPDLDALPDGDDGVVGLVRDCPVVTPQGGGISSDPRFRELLQEAFRARMDQPVMPSGPLAEPSATLTLVDTIPEELVTSGLVPNSRHGLTLRELLEGLVCEGDRCIAEVNNALGLPRLGDEQDRVDPERGGYYGSLPDLARGVVGATSAWLQRARTRHLILILAVGWEPHEQLGPLALLDAPIERLLTPDAIATVPVPVQAILAALVHASCKDALIIASAGNESAAACEQSGPVGPGFLTRLPAPSPDECARLGFGGDATSVAAGPLVHAVSHVGLDGAPLSNARSGATASLVAPGVAFGTTTGTSEMLTGSSVAAAALAVTAAWVWSYFPHLTGTEVMEIVHESGQPLPGGGSSDFQLGTRPLEVRQVSTCDALRAACNYADTPACQTPPDCIDLPDRTQALAAHGASMLACAGPAARRISIGDEFADPSEEDSACGQAIVTWPATALPETTTSSWPWAEPTPPVTYCPRCIAVVSDPPQHLTAGLALAAVPDASHPVLLEVKTSDGVHRYPLAPSDLQPDRTNVVDISPAVPWPDVTGARLVYFVRTLRGELVTRGDPLLMLTAPERIEDIVCPSGACGDGVVQSPETCDDGNLVDNDACNNACQYNPG